MAEHWYRTIAGEAADEKIIRSLHKKSYDIDSMMRAYLAWRRGE